MTRRPIGWLVAAAAIAVAAPARADDGLVWSAADRCGSVDGLRDRIAVHLGRPLVAGDAIRAVVEVVRTPIEGDVLATVQIVTRRGRTAREVRGASCADVVEAVAFVLASAVSEDGEVPRRASSPQVVNDAVVPWVIRPGPELGARREHPAVQLGLDGWSDAGTLPQLRLGVGGSLAVSEGRFRAELSAAAWEDGWSPLNEQTPGAAAVTLRSVGLRGCYGVWRLWLCGGLLQGRLRGTSEVHAWTALSFQTLWSRSIGGPVRIAGSIEGVVNVTRPQLTLTGGRHQPAPIAVRLGLGLAVAVW